MSVNSPISPCRLTRESYTSYFTLQISNITCVIRPTKSSVDNFDDNYDFNGKVIVRFT
jgi:hypothetical protein